ncbi:hypothetical protein SVIOM74S_01037 [Streptomyces violarus]
MSGFSSGACPPTSLIAAAYIPARPRADATPPTEAGPLARISGMLGSEARSVGSAALRLKAIEASVCGPVGVASRMACWAGVGAIGWVVRKRGSWGAGRPRWKSRAYGVRIRSW